MAANLKAAFIASASAGAMLFAVPALAQTAAVSKTDTAGSTPTQAGGDLLGLVVTSRRREESAQSVPIALSVVGAQALQRTGISNVSQLNQLVPTVQVLSTNPRNTAVTIRGLGASYGLANDGLEQGVGIYVDQVYNARPATATFDFVDIDQIEVLRGPQGTLFGKNTTAGALNITTRSPGFSPEAQAELSVGNYNYLQAKASLSGALVGDQLAGSLSLVGTRRDGTIENVTVRRKQNDIKNIAVRGQLLFKPTDQLKIRFYGDFSRQEPECCTQLYVTYGKTLKPAAQQYPALAAGLNYAPPSLNPYDRLTDVDGAIKAHQTLQGLAAIVDYDLGVATLTSVSAAREWFWRPANDRDYTALDIVRQSANPSHQEQYSQELRLASNGSKAVEWVAGLYYFYQDVATNGVTEYGRNASYWLLPATNSPAALLDGYKIFNNSDISTNSYAAFGQINWNINSRLRVTPGLRYTYESKSGAYAATTTGGGATTDPTLITRRLGIARDQSYSASLSEGKVSGQLAVSYDVNADVHAYGTYSQGFKSSGINMAGLPLTPAGLPALTNAVVKPEQVRTFELGLKTQLFHRFMVFNLAAFRTGVDNYQANVVDSGPGALRGYLANVKKVKVHGAEVDLNTRSVHGFSGYLNLAWTDGEYTSFTNGPCPLELIGTSTAACNLSGRELPGVSRWAGSAGVEYRR